MKIHMQFFCVGIWLFCVSLRAEGFIADTLVHISGLSTVPIKQVCEKIGGGQKQFVSSWHEKRDLWDSKRVRRAGRGTINCTVTLSFDSDQAHDIICSPLQRFYLADRHKWVAACALHPGDTLRTQSGHCVPLRDILLNKQEAVVYALRVKKNHTFCVGHYRILTHNKRIPLLPLALMARIGVAFGTGALAGGSTGSFFGPVTMVGGFTIGGVVGAIATCAAIGCELYQYHMQIGTHQIERTVPSQSTLYVQTYQTMNSPTPGYADVGISLPVEDSTMPGGCGDMQPPKITHSGGCDQPNTVFDDMPIGCGATPPHMQHKSRVIGCGHIEVPRIGDLIVSYPILAPESSLIFEQDVATVGDKAGTKIKPEAEEKKHPHGVYEENGGKHHGNSWGDISLAPTNGQEALNTSVEVVGRKCRVSVNNGEIVILELTSSGVYHGYVVSWAEVVQAGSNGKWRSIQNALIKNRLVKPNGKLVENAKS